MTQDSGTRMLYSNRAIYDGYQLLLRPAVIQEQKLKQEHREPPLVHLLRHTQASGSISKDRQDIQQKQVHGGLREEQKHSAPTTKLPSFSELLTSIPLPREFRWSSVGLDYFSQQPTDSNLQIHASNFPGRRARSIPTPTGTVSTPPFTGPVSPLHSLPSPSSAWVPSPGTIASQSSTSSTTPRKLVEPSSSIVFVNTSSNPAVERRTAKTVNHQQRPDGNRTKHTCKTCFRSFTTSGHLARHNRIHTGERDHQCPWPTCEARFARHDNCMQHYKTHTNGKSKRVRSTSKVMKR
ncbi:uncharacterized protein PRCAT00001823001 [Priceomyces carsonii]|uniref:uncharacterized protein n=1 Tax=Priceomyces carsonii TaxID=28549 RepID=UPI002ED9D41D|nr:unnamed protein product [Priceomyces carsonii]